MPDDTLTLSQGLIFFFFLVVSIARKVNRTLNDVFPLLDQYPGALVSLQDSTEEFVTKM